MVFINKKYVICSMNRKLSDEAAKIIAALTDDKKEERMKKNENCHR